MLSQTLQDLNTKPYTFKQLLPHHPTPALTGEYIAAGDMLEAEQGKAMTLKKSVAEMERRVGELNSANSGLARELEATK